MSRNAARKNAAISKKIPFQFNFHYDNTKCWLLLNFHSINSIPSIQFSPRPPPRAQTLPRYQYQTGMLPNLLVRHVQYCNTVLPFPLRFLTCKTTDSGCKWANQLQSYKWLLRNSLASMIQPSAGRSCRSFSGVRNTLGSGTPDGVPYQTTLSTTANSTCCVV